ncbi:MAG TPA: NAD(P)/FAD-dependent oxidoreductase [Mycobacteriales bacterium]|nr:NAD(P)/FAD-dependent oxidoreductase [Mycobacteriales bacterium]
MTEQVDVVVIGMGPGGEAAAGELADAGLSVLGIDARLLGGECPYYACVPTKMMIRAANTLAEAGRAPTLAGDGRIDPDFSRVATRIRRDATADWDDRAGVDRFTGRGGRFVRGRARLVGPHTVEVNGQRFTARRGILLNPGTDPAVPPIPGLAGTPLWTNREAVAVEHAPKSLCVIGGGPVGVEFAQMFARFGTVTTVVEASGRLLAREEPEAGDLLARVFRGERIDVRLGATVSRVEHDGTDFTVELGSDRVRAGNLLVATGRRTALADLGVEEIGLDPSARFLDPDERMRVADGVWAIGDATGRGAYTHMSMYQGSIAAGDILGRPGPGAEYHAVPRVTFTDPEVGVVGMTEAQARERGLTVRVGFASLPDSARGWIHGTGNDGFIKLVEDADAGVLVGGTSAGPAGGEVLSGLAVAVHARVRTDQLARMIYAYPTFHRAVGVALAALR